MNQGFPGGSVVESLLANAGDIGSIPALGRVHRPRGSWASGPQLLNPRTLEFMLHKKRSRCNEKPTPALVATRESPNAAMKTQRSQK